MKQSPRDKNAAPSRGAATLRSLLARYSACPAHARPLTFLAFLRAENPHVFSHHAPDQPEYRGHVWRVGGLYLCRGCTTVIAVTPISFGIALATRWPVRASTPVTATVLAALLVLAVVPLSDGPRTILHDLRRVALGCLLGSALAYVFLCDDWLLRGTVVAVYLAVLALRRLTRRLKRP